MSSLTSLYNRVVRILKDNSASRSSDEVLYLKVINEIQVEKGISIDLTKVPLPTFYKYRQKFGLPSIESVGRARRKAQEQNPWLHATPNVEAKRELLEEEFKNFAIRGGLTNE